MLEKFCKIRYASQWSQAGILPFIEFERGMELDVQGYQGYTLRCKFFLEGAQATMDATDVLTPLFDANCNTSHCARHTRGVHGNAI
jgi:hypothetical protein